MYVIQSLLDLFLPVFLGGRSVYSEVREESIIGFVLLCVEGVIHERAGSLIVSILELHKPVQTLYRSQMPE